MLQQIFPTLFFFFSSVVSTCSNTVFEDVGTCYARTKREQPSLILVPFRFEDLKKRKSLEKERSRSTMVSIVFEFLIISIVHYVDH